jgi:UDP-glucose 4-epimerase
MKKKQIAIVTGGAGFIGSHMVDLLLKKNFKVIVIDDFSGGHNKNLSQHKKNINLKIKKIDICKIKLNEKIFENCKYIFHFAGIGDIVPSIEKPTDYMNVNVQGTIKILEAARFNKIRKLVYAASASCYGLTKNKVSEKNKIDLQHPYALSKYLGEMSAFHWHRVYNLPINTIRIFNAYGPRVRTTGAYGAVIGVFFKQKIKNMPLTIVGDGKQTRDFVHVTDVARAFYLAATTKISGETFNVGTGKPQSVNFLAKLIGGKKIFLPNRPGEPKNSIADTRKIIKFLKWKPKISFTNGIQQMLININDWEKAPLWTKKTIKGATKTWFKYFK